MCSFGVFKMQRSPAGAGCKLLSLPLLPRFAWLAGFLAGWTDRRLGNQVPCLAPVQMSGTTCRTCRSSGARTLKTSSHSPTSLRCLSSLLDCALCCWIALSYFNFSTLISLLLDCPPRRWALMMCTCLRASLLPVTPVRAAVQTPPVQTLCACRRGARCPAGAMQVQIGPQIEMLRGDFEDSTAADVTWQARHTLRLLWQYPCSLQSVYFQRPAACKSACLASLRATQQPARRFIGPCATCSSHSVLRPPTHAPTYPPTLCSPQIFASPTIFSPRRTPDIEATIKEQYG